MPKFGCTCISLYTIPPFCNKNFQTQLLLRLISFSILIYHFKRFTFISMAQKIWEDCFCLQIWVAQQLHSFSREKTYEWALLHYLRLITFSIHSFTPFKYYQYIIFIKDCQIHSFGGDEECQIMVVGSEFLLIPKMFCTWKLLLVLNIVSK